MDVDEVAISLHDWQHKLALMADEMTQMAETFPAIHDVIDCVLTAAAKIDEVRP